MMLKPHLVMDIRPSEKYTKTLAAKGHAAFEYFKWQSQRSPMNLTFS